MTSDSPNKAESLKELSEIIQSEEVAGDPQTQNELSATLQDQILIQIKDWMAGSTQETPEAIRKMMGQMTEKVNWTVMFLLVQRLSQVHRLGNYLTSLEDDLLDESKIISLHPKTKEKQHAQLTKIYLDTLEFTRKFTAQAAESLDTENDPYRNLLERLRSIPYDKLQKVVEQLEDDQPPKPPKLEL